MIRKITLLLGVLIVFLAMTHIFLWRIVRIDGQYFFAQVPSREADYEKGLGGRKTMSEKQAMLFNFDKKDKWAFWMKGMEFDLDIIWISDGKVVYIKKNFSASSAEVAAPDVPADRVLEIRAGMADKYGLKVGDRADIF